MKTGQNKLFSIIAIVVIVILLIRFFPFAVRAAEAAALGVRQFWWLVLVLVFVSWIFFLIKKRP